MAATLVGFTGFAAQDESEELLSLQPQWDSSVTVRGGGGYKDNVLLSHFQPQGSAFASAGAEVMALRASPSGLLMTLLASGEMQRFYATEVAHNEYSLISQGRLEYDLNPWLQGSFAAQYLYQDQVLDLSISETNREAMPVNGHIISARPGLRFALPRDCWVMFEPAVSRQLFASPLDDYWQTGPKLALGRMFGRNSEVSASWEPTWLFYDAEAAHDASGAAIDGTRRERFQNEARLKWRQGWDTPGHWRTTAALGFRANQENGAGYFDYDRWLISGGAEYRAGRWKFSGEARLAYYEYPHQSSDTDSGPRRRRTEFSAGARIERELVKRLKLVFSYDYERVLSNDALESYTVNTFSGSLQCEF